MGKEKRKTYGSRLRFAWIPVWVLFLFLSVLMFCNKGRYIHTLQVELVPTAKEFQMKVLVDGKNIKVSYHEPHLSIVSEKIFTGNQTEIVIKGEWDREPVYDKEAGKTVQLQLSFHNDSPESNWQLKAGEGADSVQAFFVAEQFTGTPGQYVPLNETIRGFKEILEGKHDDLPEGAFYMVGTIDDAIKKAESMKVD